MSAIARRFASSVARGFSSTGSRPSAAASSRNAAMYDPCTRAATRRPRCDALMVLSSTSVKFMTWRISVAFLVLQGAPQHVEADERPEIADVAAGVDRQPARVHADGLAVGRNERPLRFGSAC